MKEEGEVEGKAEEEEEQERGGGWGGWLGTNTVIIKILYFHTWNFSSHST